MFYNPVVEYFDVVDEAENITGKASRAECHQNPKLIHRTCNFTLLDKKSRKILLTQRSGNKTYDPGKLCFMGEHMLSGETWTDVLKRGVKEELGLEAENYTEAAKNIFRYDKQTEIIRLFLVDKPGGEIIFDKNEITALYWVNTDELIRNKSNYSEMTRYWVENVEWKKYL